MPGALSATCPWEGATGPVPAWPPGLSAEMPPKRPWAPRRGRPALALRVEEAHGRVVPSRGSGPAAWPEIKLYGFFAEFSNRLGAGPALTPWPSKTFTMINSFVWELYFISLYPNARPRSCA